MAGYSTSYLVMLMAQIPDSYRLVYLKPNASGMLICIPTMVYLDH
jgi:hypothetical protein